jgi:hypothetical protein
MTRIPGEHLPNIKNRSSKHLIWFTKIRPILRCVNNEVLTRWSNNGHRSAYAELQRRKNKKDKKELMSV